jgi:HdeA/HdeB family
LRFIASALGVALDDKLIAELSPATSKGKRTERLERWDSKFLIGAVLGLMIAITGSSANAQVELNAYADSAGYIDVQKLTCSQLANTFQEDADFLGVWYSGWYNGLAKKHAINVPRVKEQIHNVIVYCKANNDKLVIQAIDVMAKQEQQQKKQ